MRATLYAFHHHVPSGKFRGRAWTVNPVGTNPLFKDNLVGAREVPAGHWEDHLAGQVESCTISGNHFTLMQDPWVEELASTVERWLRANAAFAAPPPRPRNARHRPCRRTP